MSENNTVEIADVSELKPGQMKKVSVDGKQLLLANAEGQYYLVDEMCSHEDFSLYLGCIKGKQIKCSLHGSHFSLETGEPLDEPACEAINTYKVVIDGEKIRYQP